MALPSWLSVSPDTGSGGKVISVQADSNNSGTSARSYNIVIKTNSGLQKTVKVNQAAPLTTVNIHFHGINNASIPVYENFPLSFYSGQIVLLATAVGSGTQVSSGSQFTAADKQVTIVSNRNIDGVVLSISGTTGVGFRSDTRVSVGAAEAYVSVVGQKVIISPSKWLQPGGQIDVDVYVVVTN